MNNFPKITVVTPCYNMVTFLEKTILSILNQNYPNLEYIIIDGGSNDGSIDIIKKYESKLSYWISEKDNGMYEAIQKGFEKSSGEIMCWLNADDLALPNSLLNVALIFDKYPTCNWIEGNNVICDESGSFINSKIANHHTKYHFLQNNHLTSDGSNLVSFGTIQQESCFWRRDLWNKAGGKLDTSLKLGGDFELWMRFYKYADLYTTPVLLSAFRIRKDQGSTKYRKSYIEEINGILKQEKTTLSSSDKKVIRFLRLVKTLPFLLYIPNFKRKFQFYTTNISLSL